MTRRFVLLQKAVAGSDKSEALVLAISSIVAIEPAKIAGPPKCAARDCLLITTTLGRDYAVRDQLDGLAAILEDRPQ